MRWTLHYDPEVTAYLYSLRDEGEAVRQAIRDLGTNPLPEGSWQLPDRPNMYEFEIRGFWLTYAIDEANKIVYMLEVERLAD